MININLQVKRLLSKVWRSEHLIQDANMYFIGLFNLPITPEVSRSLELEQLGYPI